MAQPQIQTRKETQNIIRDYNGKIILEIGQTQYTVRTSNGELIHRSLNESIQLADGSLWSPLMLVQNPPIYVGICPFCRKRKFFRRPKHHGIVALHRAKLCSCGELCCPKHSRKSKDNQWRCIPCNKKFKLANFLKLIFCQRKG